MNRLHEVLQSNPPNLAAVVGAPMESSEIEAIAGIADVVEMRADLFPSQELTYLREQAQRLRALPILLTIRSEAEGGEWDGSPDDRLELYEELVSVVDGVDIERSSSIRDNVIKVARASGKISIVSRHDFTGIRDVEDLIGQANRSNYGAHYLKFACMVDTIRDYNRLADFTSWGRHRNLITVGMGAYGPLSRVALPALGSRLTYAFAGDQPIAPGQLSVATSREYFDQLYPSQ